MINAKPSRNGMQNVSLPEASKGESEYLPVRTKSSTNRLGELERLAVFARLIPETLLQRFSLQFPFHLRSWAIHDQLIGEPFTDVTMYKKIGKQANLNTCPGCGW